MKLRRFIKNNLGVGQQKSLLTAIPVVVILTAAAATAITSEHYTDVARQGFINADAQAEKIITSLVNSEGRSATEYGTDWSEDPLLVPEILEDPGLLLDDETISDDVMDDSNPQVEVENNDYDDLAVISLEYAVISSGGSTGSSTFGGESSESELGGDPSQSSSSGGTTKDGDDPATGLSPGDEITVTATVRDIFEDISHENTGFEYKIVLWPYYEISAQGELEGLGADGDYEFVVIDDSYGPVDDAEVKITSPTIVLPNTEVCHVKFVITNVLSVDDYNSNNNDKTVDFNLDSSLNNAPEIINIFGPDYPLEGVEFIYTIQILEPDDDPVLVTVDWGDGSNPVTYGPYTSLGDVIDYYGDDSNFGGDSGLGTSGATSGAGSSGSSGVDTNDGYVQGLDDDYGIYVIVELTYTYQTTGQKLIVVEAEDDQGESDTDTYSVTVESDDSPFLWVVYGVNQYPTGTNGGYWYETNFSTSLCQMCAMKLNGEWDDPDPIYDYTWFSKTIEEIDSGYSYYEDPHLNSEDPIDKFIAYTTHILMGRGVSIEVYYGSGAEGPFRANTREFTPLYPRPFPSFNVEAFLGITGIPTGAGAIGLFDNLLINTETSTVVVAGTQSTVQSMDIFNDVVLGGTDDIGLGAGVVLGGNAI